MCSIASKGVRQMIIDRGYVLTGAQDVVGMCEWEDVAFASESSSRVDDSCVCGCIGDCNCVLGCDGRDCGDVCCVCGARSSQEELWGEGDFKACANAGHCQARLLAARWREYRELHPYKRPSPVLAARVELGELKTPYAELLAEA